MTDPVHETQLLRLSDLRTGGDVVGFTVADARKVLEADPRDLIDDMVARGRLRPTPSGRYVKVRPAPPPVPAAPPVELREPVSPRAPDHGPLFRRSA